MSDTFVVCSNLSFSWPDDTPVFQKLSFAVGGGRTGLVAPNGAGKTTLLALIAGQLEPRSGTVFVDGTLGYLPQSLPMVGGLTVAEVMGIDSSIKALAALEAGHASDAVFADIGNDWDIEDRTRAQLDRLGLDGLELDRRLDTLSGGQIVSLGLAAQLLRRPKVLLLDEPTNNLDLTARRKLNAVIDEFNGCLLLVSHDRELLNRMDRILELEGSDIRSYGGNFADYELALQAERQTAESAIRTAEQQVKREKREMQQARERAARRAGTAARNIKSAGLPKIVAGAMKRSAQESAGKANETHAARLGDARARLDDAERSLREQRAMALELPATSVPPGRTVFHGEGLQIHYGGCAVFAGGGVAIDIRGPERIALTGPNGAGKSTLLRLIGGQFEPEGGVIRRTDGRIAYLSQRLDLLDPAGSVLDNLVTFAPAMAQAQRMHLLARFLFRGPRIHLPVGVLSGGERLRATLACVLFAEPAPQLLLLDEPTNNLDLVSVGQLESALTAYQGAFVVVSHDERFLTEVNVNRWLHLEGGCLREAGPPERAGA